MGMESRLPRTPAGQTKSKNSQIWKEVQKGDVLMEVLRRCASKNLSFYDEYIYIYEYIDYIYIYIYIVFIYVIYIYIFAHYTLHLHHYTSYINIVSHP